MEVFFSPIKQTARGESSDDRNCNSGVGARDNLKYKCYPNFSYIRLCDLNILCDCPLISKSDIDSEANRDFFAELGLEELHDDTLFPITFLFNSPSCDNASGEGKESSEPPNNGLLSGDKDCKVGSRCSCQDSFGDLDGDGCVIGETEDCFSGSETAADLDDDNAKGENGSNSDGEESRSNESEREDEDNYKYGRVNYSNYRNIGKHRSNKINIDLILITNPAGLTGIPFLLYYNNFEKENCDKMRTGYLNESSAELGNLYKWILQFPSKFDVTNSVLLITPHVYQASLIGIQQLIEYNSSYMQKDYNDIVDPFVEMKTSDLYNMLFVDKKDESLETRSRMFNNLQENRSEYFYKDSDLSNSLLIRDKYNNVISTNNRKYNTLESTITTSSHIFDGNITQNLPGTIGCNTSNTSISNPPLFGNLSGEEMSLYPRILHEDKYLLNTFSNNNRKSYICSPCRSFEIRIVHIGEHIEIEKSVCKFQVHAFSSGFSLGSVGFHISVRNVDFDPQKPFNNVTILGPTSIELDRYPAPLCLNDLLKSNYLVYYGNYFSEVRDESHPEEGGLNGDPGSNTSDDCNVSSNRKSSSTYESQVDKIVDSIVSTINRNGSTLIPIDCFGLHCFEIVETIGQRISELALSKQVPIYIVGGGLSTIILHGDISSEWTAYSRSRKSMLPNPSPPFLFSFLKKSNRLYVFHDLKGLSTVYREPGVFLASNSDLKYGPCTELFRILNNKPENTLIVIDSYLYFDSFIKGYDDVKMSILHIPLCIEPNIYELLNTMMPYFDQNKFSIIMPNHKQTVLNINNNSVKKMRNNIIAVPITRNIVFSENNCNRIFNFTNNWLPVTLSCDFIDSAILKQLDNNKFISKINCNFYFSEGEIVVDKYTPDEEGDLNNELLDDTELFKNAIANIEIKSEDELQDEDVTNHKSNDLEDDQIILFGKITIKTLINQLKINNISDIVLNLNDEFLDKKDITSISIPSLSCKIIIISSNNVIINTKNNDSRETIYNIISNLLTCV
ncbi:hypothetical protein FG386_003457 [Cryptosporidium ryanae]|uniref:uncharacterized protein n=1 Tax=Cryptosporidium ryanae TaxID=515981 RepID=UPI00351A6156|nr:hypothetical protein FG386_003457 [Cryptosporidium ryanae]